MPGTRMINRRGAAASLAALLLARAGAGGARSADADDYGPAPSLYNMTMQPLLVSTLYGLAFTGQFNAAGAAESNQQQYVGVGFQRWGADWLTQGLATKRQDWIDRGWLQLDYGLKFQQPDGSFGGIDEFFAAGQFIEALARACLLDPERGRSRIGPLLKAARWHMTPAAEARGVPLNQAYTHRSYGFAAAHGMTARLTGDQAQRGRAEAWARKALGAQWPNGVNPEVGGFDASYHMVSIMVAMRYLSVCDDTGQRAAIRAMTRRAITFELTRLGPDGHIDAAGSTRIGKEKLLDGRPKSVNYPEVLKALCFASIAVPDPRWLEPAQRVAAYLDRK